MRNSIKRGNNSGRHLHWHKNSGREGSKTIPKREKLLFRVQVGVPN